MNEAARSLLESKLRLRDIIVRIDAGKSCCPMCGAVLTVQKTSPNEIVTDIHGTLNGWWPTQGCPNGCKTENGRLFTKRAEKLDNLVMKNHKFGYDLEVAVGIHRYLNHMQIDEIYLELKAEGKTMSPASISRYSYQFLDHLEQLHVAHLPDLAKAMKEDGGYYMLFDSTCEVGSGSLFNVLSGWKNWIVGSWRQSTENTKEMLPHVAYLIEVLGLPLAIMKDLSKQGQNVAEEITKKHPDADIRIFACHFHFLQDIGKDILYEDHNRLKELISDSKASLASLIRETRDCISGDSESIASTVTKWLANPDNISITMDTNAIAIVRYMAQWVLDSSQDGENKRFPFVLPYLLFYDRVVRMAHMSSSFLNNNMGDSRSKAYKLLCKLNKITTMLASNRNALKVAESLRVKNNLFVKLRTVLRLEMKTEINDACDTTQARREFSEKVKADFESFTADLKEKQGSHKVKGDVKTAIGIILKHADKYNDTLWGHDIPITYPDGRISMRTADRTNNQCEQFFATTKNNERRRSGRKNLKWDLTVRPAAVSLVENLKNEEYLKIVCNGSLENLPMLFANLENNPSPYLAEQVDSYRKCVATVFDSGRLPRTDVIMIRSDCFIAKLSSLEAVSS